jgi:hypothetical protein
MKGAAMSRFRLRTPSPALVISLIALSVSLGGVSYGFATGTIDSRELKNNTVRTADLRNNDVRSADIRNNTISSRDIRTSTITGGDVKSNTLTGRDILESSLGIVPSSNTANLATRANTAGALDGLVRGSASLTDGATDKDLFSLNGFRVFLRCTGGSTQAYIQNVSAGDNASGNSSDMGDTDFDQSEEFSVNTTSGSSSPSVFTAFGAKGAISGVVGIFDGTNDCRANGSATG